MSHPRVGQDAANVRRIRARRSFQAQSTVSPHGPSAPVAERYHSPIPLPAYTAGAGRATIARHLRQPENDLGIEHARGVRLTDRSGREWVDLSAGTLNLALGYGDPEVAMAVYLQTLDMSYASSRFTPSCVREFLDLVAEHIADPACSDLSFKLSNGSDANETLVKAARRFTGRRTMLVQLQSHLGESSETHSLSGKAFESKPAICGSRDRQFISPPDCARCPFHRTPATCDVECVVEAETYLKYMRDDLAGVLVEPVIVNRGVLFSSRTQEYLLRLQAAAQSGGVPFLVDEIQSWPWVDGQTFTSYFGLNPDGQSFAKGVAPGLAVAVAAMRPELANALIYNDAEHTNGGSPPACAGAAANITKIVNNDWHIVEKGLVLAEGLARIAGLPAVAAVRRIGLIGAIDLDRGEPAHAEAAAARIYDAALDRGVVLRRSGSALLIKPPIIIEPRELLHALEIVGVAIEELSWT